MNIKFFKYQGTGNDFVIIDDRQNTYDTKNIELTSFLCNRRFGIGADGLMLLRNADGYDFEMVYFNSDGNLSSMCGNGGRCITAFSMMLGVIKSEGRFIATDGPHEFIVGKDDNQNSSVKLRMNDVSNIELAEDYVYLNTGSPHFVTFVEDIDIINVVERGKAVRYSERFKKEGTNVNFVSKGDGFLNVRTYERGVEDETLSCGTGVTASTLAAHAKGIIKGNSSKIKTPGGNLEVYFEAILDGYKNVWLEGPATLVFKGEIDV